jgi:iron-sulfur cluster repair protein YtfE (RIC family)
MEKDYYELFAAHHRRLISKVDDLGKQAAEESLNTPELLTYLWEYLVPHAQGEEATLYQRAATLPGGNPLVQEMSGEHKVIVQHIRDLGQLFETQQDTEVQRVLHALLTFIHAHFHKEEELLIPLLRKYLTGDEFGTLIEETHKVERDVRPSDIKRFMDVDHRRIDRIIEAFSTLKRSDFGKAVALFARGKTGLLQHIRWEEDLLFPAFEEKTNMHDSGPTMVMRQEHAQIKAVLERIDGLLAAGKLNDCEPVTQELTSTLAMHNQKEELILYPMINRSLSAQERTELLNKMQ